MRIPIILLSLAFSFFVTANVHAADPTDPAPLPTWSNFTQGGGTVSMMRIGKGFRPDLTASADYLVCHTKGSDLITIDTPALSSNALEISSGKCACLNRPANLSFRNGASVENVISGTYEAFYPGKSCTGSRLRVTAPKRLTLSCQPIYSHGKPQELAEHRSALVCTVPIGSRKASYRLCSTKQSLVKKDGSSYDIGWARVVVDRTLIDKNHAGETGQFLLEYSSLNGNCIDFYDVNQMAVLIGPYPPSADHNSLLVDHVELTLQTIGGRSK
jgi:hypothetical protein